MPGERRPPTSGKEPQPVPNSPLLLDITHLIWAAQQVGPSGIDRIELEYAQHFVVEQAVRPTYAVLHLFGFLFAVSAAGGRRFIEELSAHWQGSRPATRGERMKRVLGMRLRLLGSAWMGGRRLRTALKQLRRPVYLVVSYRRLSQASSLRNIRRAYSARTVCFVHDLIPVECPEYFRPGEEQRHHVKFGNVGRLFDAAIVNSNVTAHALEAYLEAANGSDRKPKICVATPGVRPFVAQTPGTQPPDRPYFVILGTIEPRKNHLLLLNLWSRLATSMALPPRLLVVGKRGWENEQVLDMLERSRRLRGLVEECNRLADADIGPVLAHARALLLPSLAEGFGLPLAEALASGVPVICSDIPVFREVGRDVPDYLDPFDLPAWMDAVTDYASPDSPRRAAQMLRLARWRAPGWVDHFDAVDRLLDDLDRLEVRVLQA
jgi:glycosyltransferase involved in cell wall biosynthesis